MDIDEETELDRAKSLENTKPEEAIKIYESVVFQKEVPEEEDEVFSF